MPRKLIRQFLPEPSALREQKLFQICEQWLGDPVLWQLSRNSFATGVAVGLFCAYLPMPLETLVAILMAVVFRGNILVAVALVWISNPLTWPFMFGTAYVLGAKICSGFDFYQYDFFNTFPLAKRYIELWVGCLIIGPILAAVGYFTTLGLWRLHVVTRWRERKRFRLKKSKPSH